MPVESTNKPASPPPDKLERFHTEMPQIPGVNNARPIASASATNADAKRLLQIGGLAAAALLMAIAILWWMKRASHGAPESPTSDPAAAAAAPPFVAEAPDASDTAGPTVAATAEELAEPWSSKQFTFVRPFSHEHLNAMVIRLPGGVLWAFALREAFGKCDLEYVTDLAQLAKQYGYRASHPMVASPCSSTVYDPLNVGPFGGNVWVRGEIVQGGSLRPPISINVEENGRFITADRIE
jgi:hypothetical protein